MFKGRHFDRPVILLCVRWYLAYGLSLRDLKEMMAERGISIDHSTTNRWVIHFSPLLLKRFQRKALERHGRPDRIVIDGSQTNRETIISCDAEDRLRDRSRRDLTQIR